MKLLFLIFFLFVTYRTLSQNYSISGLLIDESNNPLKSTKVTITHNKDSIKFISGKDGLFASNPLAPGLYFLSVSARGYNDYIDTVRLSSKSVNLGTIRLSPSIHQLDEVKIVAKVLAMVQKDDTLEFNAGAYKVNPDADAADLVRKMPSLEISGKNVTAQGESVVKVLVDGKPFFDNDPYASLKNLPAEIIDKVQVYNEKSEQEQFTGFSEGNTSKTINIITKPDKRNGLFGKAYAGLGGDNGGGGKYGTGFTLNGFDHDRRITLTGQSNNINIQNFSDPNAAGNGEYGLTNTKATGVNYTDKWGKKMDITASYYFNETNTTVTSQLRKTFILPADSGQVYNQNSPTSSQNFSHRVSARINYKADTLNSLLWQPSFSFNKGSGNSQMQGNTAQGTEPINETININSTSHSGIIFGNDLLFRHKFNKKGRTFSLDLKATENINDGSTFHKSQNIYYNSPSLSDSFNQQSQNKQGTWNAIGNATYTEPEGGHGLLKLEYNFSYLPSRSANNTNDYSYLTGAYSIPDSIYSNSFYSKNIAHKAGSSFQFHTENIDASVGLNYQFTTLNNEQSLPVSFHLNRFYQNVLPIATLNYKLSKTKNLQMNYNTHTQPPSVNQLQNVVNNVNPLNLSTGNPDLMQTFQHKLTLRYNSLNKRAKNNFSASLSGNYTRNGITSNSIVAANDTFIASYHILLPKGSRLTLPENINGNKGLSANLNYSMPIAAIKCNLKFGLGAGISQVPALINNQLNMQINKTGNLSVTLSSNISENVDFIVSSNSSLTSNSNSLNAQLNTTYINENCKASLNVIFWKSFVFNTNLSYQSNSGLSAGYNQDYILWNMGIGKKLLKKRQLDIRVTANDLLNENNNIQHTITENYIQDARNNMLQRYFLLVCTYKINDFKK